MTNAPIFLNLDCDSYSNDPMTPLRALCYYLDPKIKPELAYVQFPQIFHGINKNDIYGSEWKSYVQINAYGMDGLMGPNYIGTGSFFQRRAFFGDPLSILLPEIPELSPDYQVCKPIHDKEVLALADHVAGCKYEDQTRWGYEVISVISCLLIFFKDRQCFGRSSYSNTHAHMLSSNLGLFLLRNRVFSMLQC